jgi:hypothetical protein
VHGCALPEYGALGSASSAFAQGGDAFFNQQRIEAQCDVVFQTPTIGRVFLGTNDGVKSKFSSTVLSML